jgi:two-component system chemotaxis response regulator CheY
VSGVTSTDTALNKLRLLLVDDNAAMRGIVRTVLSAFGCTYVFEASSAKQAMHVLRNQPIDLMILDWKMQPVDGMALVRRLRADACERLTYLPIIMLTAYAEPAKVREARDAGVTEFLVKPFTSEGLYMRLANIVNRPRPFVRTKSFFGPDRRRFTSEFEGQERREEASIA